MKLIVEKDYDGMSEVAAKIMIDEIKNNPNINLGLATGSTTKGLYKRIIDAHERGKVDFSNVKSFNLDEYIGLDGTHPSSYRYFMDTNLFNHININKNKTYIPDGKAKNLETYTKDYDELIEKKGGIDLQILGIGTNGHIAFIEPSDEIAIDTSVVKLTENTIKDNSRFFNTLDEVPKTAISMGISGILKAEKIILMASGKHKREAINNFLKSEKISTYLPASFLYLHRDVTVIIDEAVYKE